ncbi:MAG: 4a-hydroxytetrahydrobiopterin dehydratase [Phycisphaerales bacterium]
MRRSTVVEKLKENLVKAKLEELTQWSEMNGSIQRTFQFKDFVEAMKFVNTAADHAEEVQHHPDILIRWNKVTLTLSTHDAGGISHKDFEFADFVDAFA